jgi:hypothetical protein
MKHPFCDICGLQIEPVPAHKLVVPVAELEAEYMRKSLVDGHYKKPIVQTRTIVGFADNDNAPAGLKDIDPDVCPKCRWIMAQRIADRLKRALPPERVSMVTEEDDDGDRGEAGQAETA